MIGANVRGPDPGDIEKVKRYSRQTIERAALNSIGQIERRGKSAIRNRFAAAGLGRLGNAIGSTSDKSVKKRYGDGGFAVSAGFFARTRSERTLGAIESYTEGSEIRPSRSRWLWIATDDIPRVTGRYRMTPALYRENGFEQKIGPLVFIKSVNGYPLLVVKDASVSAVGKARSAKSLTKRGGLRKGQRAKEFIVAFVGIPRTSRAARVNITEIGRQLRAELPGVFITELQRIWR